MACGVVARVTAGGVGVSGSGCPAGVRDGSDGMNVLSVLPDCMYMHSKNGPDCAYMHSTAPACNRTMAPYLQDLTVLTPRLIALCCHPSPGGGTYPAGHRTSAPALAAHFRSRLVDDPGLEPEPVGKHLNRHAFGYLAVNREHDTADEPFGRGPVAKRHVEDGVGQRHVFAGNLAGPRKAGHVFRSLETSGRDALAGEPPVRLGFGALSEVGVGDMHPVAHVEPQRRPVVPGRAAHRPPALSPLGDIGPCRDVLAEALGGGKQAAHSGYPVLARMATDRSKWHNEHAP